MNKILFSVKRIRIDKENTNILSIDDLVIRKGEFIVVAGPNGAGKTILFHTLLGMITNKKNSLSYKGTQIKKVLSQSKDLISYVPQHPENFMLGATVNDDLLFSSTLEQLYMQKELLEELKIRHLLVRSTSVLSGGEKKRVALASALLTKPEILFLDEPFTELDFDGIKELISILKNLHRRGTTIVLITHDLSKILALATRLIILDKANIVFDDVPHELTNDCEKFGVRFPEVPVEECSWL